MFVRWDITANHALNSGLSTDDPMPTRPDREQVWNDYNNAWLALLQRQKDMMESGQQLGRSQTILSQETLEHLGKKLTEMCDKLEKFGLVDYQRGVWEERIIASKSSQMQSRLCRMLTTLRSSWGMYRSFRGTRSR